MRRLQAVVLACLAVTAMLWAARTSVSDARVRRVRFEVLEVASSRQQKFDIANPGTFTPGDSGVGRSRGIFGGNCKSAGTFYSHLVVVKGGTRSPEGIVDLGLNTEAGKIAAYFSGQIADREKGGWRGPVVGGTGRYRDVTGQVTWQEGVTRCGKKGSLFSFDLLLKSAGTTEPEPEPVPTPTPTPTPVVTPTPASTPTGIPTTAGPLS